MCRNPDVCRPLLGGRGFRPDGLRGAGRGGGEPRPVVVFNNNRNDNNATAVEPRGDRGATGNSRLDGARENIILKRV